MTAKLACRSLTLVVLCWGVCFADPPGGDAQRGAAEIALRVEAGRLCT